MLTTKEILPGVTNRPQVIETVLGKVEFDLTEGGCPVVLASHGGIGGVDQARLLFGSRRVLTAIFLSSGLSEYTSFQRAEL